MIHVDIYLKVLLISVCLEVTRMWYILYDEVFSRSWEKGGEKAKERERWSRCDGRGDDELDDPLFTRIHRCDITNNLSNVFVKNLQNFPSSFVRRFYLRYIRSSFILCVSVSSPIVQYNTDSVNNRARVSRRLRSFFRCFLCSCSTRTLSH